MCDSKLFVTWHLRTDKSAIVSKHMASYARCLRKEMQFRAGFKSKSKQLKQAMLMKIISPWQTIEISNYQLR